MLYEKSFYKVKNKFIPLEVYKMQTAIFGTPSVLIYNEDRTQIWEETKPNNVKALQEFMGNTVKCYACGFQNKKGQIQLVDLVPEKEYWF